MLGEREREDTLRCILMAWETCAVLEKETIVKIYRVMTIFLVRQIEARRILDHCK